jgi:hypothetical protein
MSKKLLIAVFAALLGSASLHAAERILVASSRSNSLEEFSASGTWLRTSLPPALMPRLHWPKAP